jgi:RNA recognition motif-containing protein
LDTSKRRRTKAPITNTTVVKSSRPEGGSSGGSQSPRPPREPKPIREFAPPNPAEVTTERLYVGNLSYDASESDLFELFNGVGNVRNAEVVVHSRTQRSKGFAFVTMATVEEARRAVVELSSKEFMGRPLQISGAKPSNRGDREEQQDTPEHAEAAAA